jgi:hypothetical protein
MKELEAECIKKVKATMEWNFLLCISQICLFIKWYILKLFITITFVLYILIFNICCLTSKRLLKIGSCVRNILKIKNITTLATPRISCIDKNRT